MKIRPVEAVLFHEEDGRDEANIPFSQFCERS
jgi:hypothetical protein